MPKTNTAPIVLWSGAGVRLLEVSDVAGFLHVEFEAQGKIIKIPGVYAVELQVALRTFHNHRRHFFARRKGR